MVTGPERGARQPHGHGPPAHGLRSRARGRDPALSPGSARFQGRWHPPCPHRAGPLCDPPGWAGGLVPAADTHHRRPAVSCTGQGKPGLSAGPSRPQRRCQPVHRRPGTLGGWGKGTVTNGGGDRLSGAESRQERGHSPGAGASGPASARPANPTPKPAAGATKPRPSPGHAARGRGRGSGATHARSPDSCGRPWSVRRGLSCRCLAPRASAPL